MLDVALLPTMPDQIQKYSPIEITTHNMHFHEDSPILAMDIYNNMLATCGFDGVVRLWKLNFKKMSCEENAYRTAVNTSVRIEYWKDLSGFSKPINCVRFATHKVDCEYMLAACADGGKVIIFIDQKAYTIQNGIDDDAYDMCWSKNLLFVGFGSGNINCYKISIIKNEKLIDQSTGTILANSKIEAEGPPAENKDCKIVETPDNLENQVIFKLIFSRKIHDSTVQGISYNEKYGLLASFSLDKTLQIHRIQGDKINLISKMDQNLDNSRGLFKRILFEGDFLYVFTKNNTVSIFTYPFGAVHLQKKIGPLNSSVVKILTAKSQNTDLLLIFTKKSVYVFDEALAYHVDNASYMAITDAAYVDNVIFLSSMDGFIGSIRFSCENKTHS